MVFIFYPETTLDENGELNFNGYYIKSVEPELDIPPLTPSGSFAGQVVSGLKEGLDKLLLDDEEKAFREQYLIREPSSPDYNK